MNVTQISIGRFHHFHLARQLERFGFLKAIYTGYPRFALRDEVGVPYDKIKTFPWLHAPYMKRGIVGLDRFQVLNKEWEWLDKQTIDNFVASRLKVPGVLVALSGNGLHAGRKMKQLGGYYICDRGSSHIQFQDEILKEEYRRWGLKFGGVDKRVIEKEEREYELADRITVPSEFVKNSFIAKGVPVSKLQMIAYGARLERFKPVGLPQSSKFSLLWVGSISIRKGFIYALRAFQKLKHPNKEFLVIGSITKEVNSLLHKESIENVRFLGQVPNNQLSKIYSSATVFVLPSIEEGLAMVIGEALACGCPVIATYNSGATELLTDNSEGFIVPIRDQEAIAEKLQLLSDQPFLREQLFNDALHRVQSMKGWDSYGKKFIDLLLEFEFADPSIT